MRAKGIPDRSTMGDLRSLPEKDLADFIIQAHSAKKAGKHFDVRVGTENTGLFSWATRKSLPIPGGRPTLLMMQSLHQHSYGKFQGEIKSRYGMGTVKTHEAGKALILEKSPNKLKFVLAHRGDPESFSLIKTKDPNKNSWLLFNTTPIKALNYEKEKYKSKREEDIPSLIKDPSVGLTPKIDGAAVLLKTRKNTADIYSYRDSVSGLPITHGHRIGLSLKELKLPKEFQDKLIRGELWAERKGNAIPAQELGGLLNSSVMKSLEKQKKENIQPRMALFGEVPEGGKTSFDMPVELQQKAMQRLLEHLPKDIFHTLEIAKTPEAKEKLWNKIKNKKHPQTEEGVVALPLEGGIPSKVKLISEHDVIIQEIFPGEAGLKGKAAGGFKYSLPGDNRVVGEVGTGFNSVTRKEMHEHPERFIGRTAKIEAQGQFSSNSYRSPVFLSLHEDIPMKKLSLLKESSTPAGRVAARYKDCTGMGLSGSIAAAFGCIRHDNKTWCPNARFERLKSLMQSIKQDLKK